MGQGQFVGRCHVLPLRVYYEDTDAAGIVYYANYLKYAERGRTEMLRSVGTDHRQLAATDGVFFAVRRCAADYLKPAQLDDELAVWTEVSEVSGARMTAEQIIRRDVDDLVRLSVTLACIDRDGRPRRIPERLRKTWTQLTTSG
ncbi:MAG: tol-pal system-associated acyl-CoA thioesterase [Rhodospirillales bacterium]